MELVKHETVACIFEHILLRQFLIEEFLQMDV